jgi:hypothetical protein
MVCGTEGVTIFVGDTEVLCTAGGQSQSVFGFTDTLICPDPDIVCGILAYKGNGTQGSARASPSPTIARTRIPPPRSSQPEVSLEVTETTGVASSSVLLRLTGGGVIEPVENSSVIRLREIIVDTAARITSVSLEVIERIEVRGGGFLGAVHGGSIVIEPEIEIVLIISEAGPPLLNLGVMGPRSEVIPGGISVLVTADVTSPGSRSIRASTGTSDSLIVGEGLNCPAWLEKTTINDSEHFRLECLTKGSEVSLNVFRVAFDPERLEAERADVTTATSNERHRAAMERMAIMIAGVVVGGGVVIVVLALIVQRRRTARVGGEKGSLSGDGQGNGSQ